MTAPYVAPTVGVDGFTCPHCHFCAHQQWSSMFRHVGKDTIPQLQFMQVPIFSLSRCDHCHEFSIWFSTELVFPPVMGAEPPNIDLPDEISKDYLEASTIVSESPRGAAALLRLAIQKLCVHLKQPGNNLNADIGALVKQGLPLEIQQALDSVRVIGNNAVHPGMLGADDVATAQMLFKLVNFIADRMISQPKQIGAFYHQQLPPTALNQIQKRDN